MAKPITCYSRDARQFFSERANWSIPSGAGSAFREFWRNTALKILKDSSCFDRSESEPIFVSDKSVECSQYGELLKGGLWIYKNRCFTESEELDFSLDERRLLVLEEFDKERRQFEKLHAKFSGISSTSLSRTKIPSQVRIFVWQRDSGKCVECSSNENLEYDHIIPFAKGGSNTERNLQLLCGNCNRLKSDNIQ